MSHSSHRVAFLLGVLIGTIFTHLLASAQREMRGPEVSKGIYYGISPALRDVPPRLDFERHSRPLLKLHPSRPYTSVTDPALQGSLTINLTANSGLNFLGIGKGFSGPAGSFSITAAPPDTNGAAGATQYVQWVNTSYAVFDKASGTAVYGPTAGNTLWSTFTGPCHNNNDGDIIAQYDKAAGRWVLAQLSVTGGPPYYLCVAVSTTSDATGTYNLYSFQYSNLDDYPKLGMWPDAYYASYNMFQGNTFVGSQVCAFDRASMLQGQTATQQCFQLSGNYGGLLPSDLDGSTAPPAGSPNYFVAFDGSLASLDLWKFHVDWLNPASTTLTGPVNIPVPTFSEACGGGTCIPQSGTSQKLDSLGDRLMYRLAYRNFSDHESLVVNHSVTSGSSVGVRWYELRNPGGSLPDVYQVSTFAPDADYRWMGSVAMDQAGNMALGYSVSGSSLYPSIRYTGRLASDALNTMQSENSIVAGSASQSYLFGGLSRWGDYSSMSVDPVDDCTFWYTTEYLISNNAFTFNWSTRVASFKFSSCGPSTVPTAPTNLTANAGDAQVSLTWAASSGAVSYNVKRSATSGSGYTTVGTTAGTNYSDTGLTNGTTYYYVVSASNSAGESSDSNQASATPQAPRPAPGFTVSAPPFSVTRGSSAQDSVTVTPLNGFTGNVTLSASGLPPKSKVSFSPNPLPISSGSTSAMSTMTLTTSASTKAKTYTMTVNGTGTGASNSASVAVTVH